MIHQWREAGRLQSASMDGQRGEARFGTVSSADPVRGAIRVNYQPSGALSGWLPMLLPWTGGGWGVMALPPIGAQVVLMPIEGDAEQCVCVGVSYNDQDAPPGGYPPDEFWLVHKSGSYIKLQGDGTVQIKGDLHVTGNIYSTANVSDAHGSVDRLRQNYNAHNHQAEGATSPTSPTLAPHQDPE